MNADEPRPTARASVQPAAQERSESPISRKKCPTLEGDAEAAYRDLQALDKKASWQERRSLAHAAAKAGHPEGQARAGGMTFSDLYQSEAPKADDAKTRAAYLEALEYLFVAAMRGSEYARGYAPDMAAIIDSGSIPAELEQPFEDVPRAWLEQALSNAKSLLSCFASSPR